MSTSACTDTYRRAVSHRQWQTLRFLIEFTDKVFSAVPICENVSDKLRETNSPLRRFRLRFVIDRLSWPTHDEFSLTFVWLRHSPTFTRLSDRTATTRRAAVMFS